MSGIGFRSRLTNCGVVGLVVATVACGHNASKTATSSAIQQGYPDSVEQALAGKFLTEYQAAARPFQQAGNYLGEMQLIRRLAEEYPRSSGVRDLTTQQLATLESFLGDPVEALRLFDTLDDEASPPPADTTRLDQLRVADAAGTIIAAADTARVIFVNEAHHVAQTRLLTLALLEPLRAKGFTYLAAETFSPFDSSLNARDYPVRTSGYYSNEPLFGEVIREARRLGYTLVPYEAIGVGGQDARETGQATNLRDRIFREHPDAHVLVHAGYSHINESGVLAGAKPMAIRFRELTGIDPFTIDQTTMREHSTRAKEHPAYRHIVDRAARTVPFVLVESDGRPWTNRPGVHDMTVFLPRTQLRDGRPDWYWRSGDRQPFAVKGSLCANHDQCVVAARVAEESPDAVPRDILIMSAKDAQRTLAVPPGRYTISVRDAAGTSLSDTTVTIAGR